MNNFKINDFAAHSMPNGIWKLYYRGRGIGEADNRQEAIRQIIKSELDVNPMRKGR